MTIRGHRLQLRLGRHVAQLQNRLARARYFRGHGVHSPFVYNLVREVFMRRGLMPGDDSLYRALLENGISQHRATQLQNLAIHCGYTTFGLNCAEADLCVVTREVSGVTLLSIIQQAAETGRTVVVLSPYEGRQRHLLCRQIIARHLSTSVDNRAYLLIFNNYLPKQHFRI